MHLFYTPDITTSTYILNEEESKHAIRVLRLQIGDTIQLIDGKGGLYVAEITDDNQKHCTIRITETKKEFFKRDWYLQIAFAPTKNMDRLEWFIEKATEIGIDEIALIDCENSERTIVKTERLKKVAVAAIKQSLKAYLPSIKDVIDLNSFIISNRNFKGQKFIAHCHEREVLPHLKNCINRRENSIILIGPEGDFSEKEIKLAVVNGFQEISLGGSRLRTETAALYACLVANVLNEK